MRILRLFIEYNLDQPIKWVAVNHTNETETGLSTFEELSQFNDIHFEVYLAANCCSIFQADITGINNRRLSEEVILGILEDNIADDITQVKPIILNTGDNVAYVAIFNQEFYKTLIENLALLNKPILFVQSFAYATIYHEDSWSIFLGSNQAFVRTSQYQYYILDDNQPIPQLLTEMLKKCNMLHQKPKSLLIYAETENKFNQIAKNLEVDCINMNSQLEYGRLVWNFYNPKSSNFDIKLDAVTKSTLFRLIRTAKYLFIALAIFWVLDIISLETNIHQLNNQLRANLLSIMPDIQINPTSLNDTFNTLEKKLIKEKHDRGIYANPDGISLFRIFLEVVSNVNENNITQIIYNQNQLQIFVNRDFNTRQFTSYINIFAVKYIAASIEDYNTYVKAQKILEDQTANNNDNTLDPSISDITAWVITLKPMVMQQ